MLLHNTIETREWRRGDYVASTDKARLELDVIHQYLSMQSYWAQNIRRDVVERAIAGSLTFGLYRHDGAQVGFGRVVTDCAVFAYIRDVFIIPTHQRRGLGTWLAQLMLGHPDLASVQNWMLATLDAHEVYRRAGFGPLLHPEWLMQILRKPGTCETSITSAKRVTP